MKFRKVLVLGLAVAAFSGMTLTASAAGLKDVFDAKFYAEQYPDLKEAFGDDEEALYQHFITMGVKENRNMSPILDVVAYRKNYSDLDAAFGDNWDAYVTHFIEFGAKENRTEGVLFNPVTYAESYPDVKEAFGDDLGAAIAHYKNTGRTECRTKGSSEGFASIADKEREEKRIAEEKARREAEEAAAAAAAAQGVDESVLMEGLQALTDLGSAYGVYWTAYRSGNVEWQNLVKRNYNELYDLVFSTRDEIVESGTQEQLTIWENHFERMRQYCNECDGAYRYATLPDKFE